MGLEHTKPKRTKNAGLKEEMERMGKGTNNQAGSGRVMEE